MEPLPVIPPQLDTPPCWLCKDCEALLLRHWSGGHLAEHKPNYYNLQGSASRGCGLCKSFCELIVEALDASIYDVSTTLRETLALGNQGHACQMFVQRVCSTEPYFRGWIDAIQYIPSFRPHDGIDFVRRDFSSSTFRTRISLLAGRNEYIGGRIVPPDVNLERCRTWIEECHRNHSRCRKTGIEAQELPTRLIDVGSPGDHGMVRLTISDNTQGRYVALSHRWGNPAPPTTTTSNLQQHLNGFSLETLPQMFQDAIFVTRKLGYQYLWIDSLCIVQDDRNDWLREHPQMTSVYGNAAVTIAGPGCVRSTDGLLRQREMAPVKRTLRVKSDDSGVDCVLQLDSHTERCFENYQGRSHLYNRAWVFQERLLSPRLLYFGLSQVCFECNSSCACEAVVDTPYPLDMPGAGTAKNFLDLPDADLYENWQQLVVNYSRLFLTFESDRLPCISGLARVVQHRLMDVYWAGLWRRDFVNGLQWQRASNEPRSLDASKVCGPSWSWVSCNFPVRHMRWYGVHSEIGIVTDYHRHSSSEHLKVLDMSLVMDGKDALGQAIQGRVKISGKLKIIHIGRVARAVRSVAVYSAGPERSRIGLAILDKPDFENRIENVRPHTDERFDPYPIEDAANAAKAICVLVSSGTEWHSHDSRTRGWLGEWVGLVLERVAVESHDSVTFRRIGLASGYQFCRTADGTRIPEEIVNPAAYFDNTEEVTIDIV